MGTLKDQTGCTRVSSSREARDLHLSRGFIRSLAKGVATWYNFQERAGEMADIAT